MGNTQKYHQEIKDLKVAILLDPESRHRIILKAIKTAKSKELGRLIRSYNKKNLI
ncbi:MAG: hypothetical protein AAF149_16200 [Bacteroidota bacterium]